MSLLTKYGTIYGQMPQVTGRVFFVAPAASVAVSPPTGAVAPIVTVSVIVVSRTFPPSSIHPLPPPPLELSGLVRIDPEELSAGPSIWVSLVFTSGKPKGAVSVMA